MNLEELRAKIDGIDDTLVQAFLQRMEVVAQVAQEKKAQGLPTLDPAREREKLADIAAKLPPELAQYGYALWSMLFEISRGYQHAVNPQPSALRKEIESAMESTPNLFPPSATVACQGVEGAYSQLACEKMFKHPQVMYFGSFESVFSAIENGFCDYGVLPLENSTAGSVKQIYDLMLRHSSFKIVRSTRLKVDHNLVAKKGTKLEDIKEIFSHPQTEIGRSLVYPNGVQIDRLPPANVIRIAFNGGSSYEPLIASLAIDCGVKVNILGADTRNIEGKAFGTMLLGLPEDSVEAAKALRYIQSQPDITVEEVTGHV